MNAGDAGDELDSVRTDWQGAHGKAASMFLSADFGSFSRRFISVLAVAWASVHRLCRMLLCPCCKWLKILACLSCFLRAGQNVRTCSQDSGILYRRIEGVDRL